MKFEIKTENENFSKSYSNVFGTFFNLSIIIMFCFVTLRLGIISRNHRIEYNCRILSIVKSKPNFKKLSRLSNLNSKQKIWEFCSDVIK